MALSEYQTVVDDLVRDQAGVITPAARDRAIAQACSAYSNHRPRLRVDDVQWPQLGYTAPVPAGWADAAWVHSAEYPLGEQPPSLVPVRKALDGVQWVLRSEAALPAGAVVRLHWFTQHEISAQADTIDVADRLPVAMYAAHLLCLQLATYYSGQRETTLGAEQSQTDTRAREYAARAKEYRSAYYAGTGQPDPFAKARGGADAGSGTAPAAVALAMPRRAGRGGLRWLVGGGW